MRKVVKPEGRNSVGEPDPVIVRDPVIVKDPVKSKLPRVFEE